MRNECITQGHCISWKDGEGGDYLYAFSGHTCLWNIKTQYKLQLPGLLFSSYIGSDCQTKNNYWDKTAEGHLY